MDLAMLFEDAFSLSSRGMTQCTGPTSSPTAEGFGTTLHVPGKGSFSSSWTPVQDTQHTTVRVTLRNSDLELIS